MGAGGVHISTAGKLSLASLFCLQGWVVSDDATPGTLRSFMRSPDNKHWRDVKVCLDSTHTFGVVIHMQEKSSLSLIQTLLRCATCAPGLV